MRRWREASDVHNKSELVACANHEIDELRFGLKPLRNRLHYVIM